MSVGARLGARPSSCTRTRSRTMINQARCASARMRRCLSVAFALAGAGSATVASAHVVAGDRIFPVTLTFDDPGVGDEATLPQFIWQPDAGPSNLYQFQWEYDKTITPTTSVIYNHGYDILEPAGQKTH